MKEELVWYASYGSNAFRDRFHCYIKGGKVRGNLRHYEGCKNPRLPLAEKNIIIPYSLYFAKKSKSWSQGGVAFITDEKTSSEPSYGRMYLITAEQFSDVLKQETRSTESISLNLSQVVKSGHLNLLKNVWYGKVIFLGTENDYPIFTFTHEHRLRDLNPPSADYLKIMLTGLKDNYGLSEPDLICYLINKPGIHGHYTEQDIQSLLEEL